MAKSPTGIRQGLNGGKQAQPGTPGDGRKAPSAQRGRAARLKGRHHLILVPGFGGFDALGSLRYYHGVTEVLQQLYEKRGEDKVADLSVLYFPNLPTASVRTRARELQYWLKELYDRRAILPGDSLHMIGHSTGGLDPRQFLTNLRQSQGDKDTLCKWPPVSIRSVQFLPTPHFGTMLAYHLGHKWLPRFASRALLTGLYQVLRVLGERGSGQVSRLGKWVTNRDLTPDWIDAALDTLGGSYRSRGRLEQATARNAYFLLLRWLLEMGRDFSAITDLDPHRPDDRSAPVSPAHQDYAGRSRDVAFLEKMRIRFRSIVTVARHPAQRLFPSIPYGLTHWLTERKPAAHFQECEVRELFDPRHTRILEPSENDGIVNSVSQVWPDTRHSCLVEGDHADVIGHYRSSSTESEEEGFFDWRQYDLLVSPSTFNEDTFRRLWLHVACYALKLPTESVIEERVKAPWSAPALATAHFGERAGLSP